MEGGGQVGWEFPKYNSCTAKAAEKKSCKGKHGEKKVKQALFANQVWRKKSCTKAITYQNKKNHTEPKGAKNISGSRKLPHHHPTEIFPYLVFLPVWVSQTCAWCEAGLGEDQTYIFLSAESETKFMRIKSSQWFKPQQSLQSTNKALDSAKTSSTRRETKRGKMCHLHIAWENMSPACAKRLHDVQGRAFELVAAYLWIKKGTKETNNNLN